jgi:HPt (histidine-containing phosphotransfer) domain-containing protein
MNDNKEHTQRLYDESILRQVNGCDETFIHSIKDIFKNTVPIEAHKLCEAATQQQWDEVYKTAHKMKSAIDMLNIVSIQQTVRLVEQYAKEQRNLHALPSLIETIQTTIEAVVAQMQSEV